MPLNVEPMPEVEETFLMEKLADILDNGGKIPSDTSNSLILAAVRESYRAAKRAVNQSRRNQGHLWVLSVSLAILIGIFLASHPGELRDLLSLAIVP